MLKEAAKGELGLMGSFPRTHHLFTSFPVPPSVSFSQVSRLLLVLLSHLGHYFHSISVANMADHQAEPSATVDAPSASPVAANLQDVEPLPEDGGDLEAVSSVSKFPQNNC